MAALAVQSHRFPALSNIFCALCSLKLVCCQCVLRLYASVSGSLRSTALVRALDIFPAKHVCSIWLVGSMTEFESQIITFKGFLIS